MTEREKIVRMCREFAVSDPPENVAANLMATDGLTGARATALMLADMIEQGQHDAIYTEDAA